jgi:hypothetical protein
MFWKHWLAHVKQLFHRHEWSSAKSLHLTGPIWPFTDPLLKICTCGASRIVENKP